MTKKSLKNFGRGQVINKTKDGRFRKPLTNEQFITRTITFSDVIDCMKKLRRMVKIYHEGSCMYGWILKTFTKNLVVYSVLV